jgi:hypothetical protein
MTSERTIRIYKNNPRRQLTTDEAADYLVTGTIPEAVALDGATKEVRATYEGMIDEKKAAYCTEAGVLTVAVGQMVRHEGAAGIELMLPAWESWEPIETLRLYLSTYNWDAYSNDDDEQAEIKIERQRIGGLSTSDTQWLLNAMNVALRVAQAAERKIAATKLVTF